MATTTTTDTIEGIVNDVVWYHYDVGNDVLYLQFVSTRGQETFGEQTPEGFILLRTDDDAVAGLTIVNWWKHFGQGAIESTTLKLLERYVEQTACQLQTAA